MTVACALKVGGDFGPEHVQWLARQVPGLVCISANDIPGVETIRPQMDLPGWWIKMNAFCPDVIQGDILLIDLDTVVLSMPPMPHETTVLQDFTRPDLMGSGFMFVTAADRARVWAEWIKGPEAHMRACNAWPKWGDQGFLQDLIGGAAKWGPEVVSYKRHCKQGVPGGAKAICFHGKPRPWDTNERWIPKMSNEFRELALAHKGKVICVMGGAASLADDLAKIKADIYISTNGHGADLVKPDYVLAMDEINKHVNAPMGGYLRDSMPGVPIISPHAYGDYRLTNWPQSPRFVLSGLVAVWAAAMMGAKCVIVAGMDAYGGDDGYIFEATKMARDIPIPVRTVSGELEDVWPRYDPSEKFGRYSVPSQIETWLGTVDGEITVEVIKPTAVRGMLRARGEQIRVARHEVHRLLKHRMLREV